MHVSRAFNNLKEQGLLERQDNVLVILEPEALMNLAEFDFQYLHSDSMLAKTPSLLPSNSGSTRIADKVESRLAAAGLKRNSVIRLRV